MDYLYIYVAVGIIIILLIVIVILLSARNKKSQNSHNKDGYTFEVDKKEERRRNQISNQISADIKTQFSKQKENLRRLSKRLTEDYESIDKTWVNIDRFNYPNLHNELVNLFSLRKDERILYCRRYEKWLGSDTFFIITDGGIGYAPRREVFPMAEFGEIKDFIANGNAGIVEVIDVYGESGFIDGEDFTYNCSNINLANILNNFLQKYKSEFDIYFDACNEALQEKATPILPSLIEKVGEINKNWANIFRANYKLLLCEDGIDIKDNSREAIYDIENILNLAGEEDKDDNIINMCLVLKAKLMLLNNEDQMDIKKLIDTVLGSNCDQFVIDEANRVRRKLTL